MKLYDGGRAPNPRRVTLYLAEKGIAVEMVPVDMGQKEHKSDLLSTKNPLQRLPILELDDGTILTETIAICRYFEELYPEPPLFGTGALERAQVEMWQRRVEWHLLLPIAQVFRHSHPHMAQMEDPQVPDWAAANRPRALRNMMIFDDVLKQRPFVAGERFTVADITGLVALDFARPARIPIPPELIHLTRWHEALRARPSAAA